MRIIISIKFRDPRSGPESLVESSLHIIRNERCPTQRTRFLLVSHPTVEAAFVEDVATVCERSDLVVGFELVEADSARLGRVDQVRELHDGEDFSDQHGRHGVEFRDTCRRVLQRNVGFEEIGQTHVVKRGVDEFS